MNMEYAWILIVALLLCPGVMSHADPGPPVTEIKLSTGTLCIPEAYRPDGDLVDVVVHFHGSPEFARDRFLESGKSGILVAISYKGLSEAYGKPFRGTDLFRKVLGEASRRIGDHYGLKRTRIRKLVLSSFSAGHGAIREILKSPQKSLVTDVVLADSLYAGYIKVNGHNAVDPDDMTSFAEFAERAAKGKATMWITYSAVVPPNYASTEETADYLIAKVGASKLPASGEDPPGLILTSKADLNGFHVRGYAGDTGPDHMRHLHALAVWLRHTSLDLSP